MKMKTFSEALTAARTELKSHQYSFKRPYLFGSTVGVGYSTHDVDILIPEYKPVSQIKGALLFQRRLSKRLGGFPVEVSSYYSFHLKQGQEFHKYWTIKYFRRI